MFDQLFVNSVQLRVSEEFKIPLISLCHRSPDNLLPSNQLLTYPKAYLDMCNKLYSVSLINFGPTTQNNPPWLGGSKLHSKL